MRTPFLFLFLQTIPVRRCFIAVSFFLLITPALFAQRCKPDTYNFDKFTQVAKSIWTEKIYSEDTFLTSHPTGSFTSLFVTLNFGTVNDSAFIYILIDLSVTTKTTNADYQETGFSEGDMFKFLFKNGDVLSATANSVYNNTFYDNAEKTQASMAIFNIPREKLSIFTQLFSNSIIDAFQIQLDNNQNINKDVNKKMSAAVLKKGVCFENHLKSKGLL
jgi:hypothetical protein